MKALKVVGKTLGGSVGMIAGLLMFAFWFVSMVHGLGVLGAVLSIFLAPGITVFPFIFWLVEGTFPVLYFVIWGVGMVGLVVAAMASSDD
jgi:hypothetical protein